MQIAVACAARLMRNWPRFERSYVRTPTGGPERDPAGVALWWGNLDILAKSVPRGVMPVAHHPEATASAMKFLGAYSHGAFEGRTGHNLLQEAPDAYADAQVGGRGT
jgi:hypothetical protein